MNHINIPNHLKQYIVQQDTDNYSIIDHSAWSFIMRISVPFYKKYAHASYFDGLHKTGITLNSIPSIKNMNEKMSKFGWGAIAVRGFIPPWAFMEFQTLGLLPIACDMRSREHLTYTPAPDIVHESSGHCPIIINEEYANFLKEYGAIASKAIFSKEDEDIYYAIRSLSDLKENRNSSMKDIKSAEKKLKLLKKNQKELSEANLLSRLHWWTVEYGLIGSLKSPKLYGAGLLSSVGESQNCLSKNIKKIPLTIDCINYNYDITEQQPQLFVAENFNHLSEVLKEFSNNMSFKVGGTLGLDRAQKSGTVCSVKFDSNFVVSGKIIKFLSSKDLIPIYINFIGPTQLSYNNSEIKNHGGDYHKDGFGCPIGKLKNSSLSIHDLTKNDLKKLKIIKNKYSIIEFESGILIKGIIKNILFYHNKVSIISVDNCYVSNKSEKLFDPEWGTYDLFSSNKVSSVFGGPSDFNSYKKFIVNINDKKISQLNNVLNNNDSDSKMISLYEKTQNNKNNLNELHKIALVLEKYYPDEWLLRFIIYSHSFKIEKEWIIKIRSYLNSYKPNSDLNKAIIRGVDTL